MNGEMVRELVAGHDYVFHLAALLGVKRTMSRPVEMIENNLLGTLNVLKSARASGSKVVFASTSEVYGKAQPPFHEDDDLNFGATSKLRWSYAIGKSLEEVLCLGYGREGLPVTIVRYFNVYGPRQKEGAYGGVISRFVKAAVLGEEITVYGDGKQTRCFTFISDTIRATMKAMERAADGHIVNIGSPFEVQINELAAMVKKLARSPSRIIHVPFEQVYPQGFEEIPKRKPNLLKMERVLHYKPVVPLQAGLGKTIEWYKEQLRKNEGGNR